MGRPMSEQQYDPFTPPLCARCGKIASSIVRIDLIGRHTMRFIVRCHGAEEIQDITYADLDGGAVLIPGVAFQQPDAPKTHDFPATGPVTGGRR